jgi:hypothetical protein
MKDASIETCHHLEYKDIIKAKQKDISSHLPETQDK